jgi:hypothetical protein
MAEIEPLWSEGGKIEWVEYSIEWVQYSIMGIDG